ncbi:MAG: substrate-binding domain-containing protein [Planctomycetales bacterium]|nr:substrate-binding domain-containing protein [Planctomycetales bacterium]
MKNVWYLCVIAVFVTSLIGCQPSTETPSDSATASDSSTQSSQSAGVIGFSALTLKNPFFKIIGDSLTAEAQKHGFDVRVNDAEEDVSTQAKHIDNFLAQGVVAIVLNPADRISIGPAIEKANAAGVPVFTCDLQCVADGIEIAGHVGTDNYQGGELAGQAMIEALGEAGGKVLILHYKQANSCVLRVDGFRAAIDTYNQGRGTGQIEIVAELEGGGSQDGGLQATADAIQTHRDLAGVFAINDPSGYGAWTALRQAGVDDQIKIVGFDGEKLGKQAIKDGKFYADPVQFPTRMGEETVRNIVKYLNGEEFEQVQLFKTELYRHEDALNDPEL